MAKEDMKSDMAQDKKLIKKAFKQHDKQEHKGGKGTTLKLCKGGKAYAKGGVTSESMVKVGRNLARVANQKSG